MDRKVTIESKIGQATNIAIDKGNEANMGSIDKKNAKVHDSVLNLGQLPPDLKTNLQNGSPELVAGWVIIQTSSGYIRIWRK